MARTTKMAAARNRVVDDLLLCLVAAETDSEDEDAIEDVETLIAFNLLNEPFGDKFRIDIETIDQKMCIELFRFTKEDIHLLFTNLLIPVIYRRPNGTVASGLESFLLLLRHLTYPNRLLDFCPLFGPEPELSMIVHEVVFSIYNHFHHLLEELDQNWIDAQLFADAIHAAGAPLKNCWGFIDGTMRPCCRPIRSQRILFSGHKRIHGIKFQSVVCPNGIIANLYGPIPGKHHDAFMLQESSLLTKLEAKFRPPHVYALYGDPAYPLRQHLLAPYKGALVTREQQLFNRGMSRGTGFS